MQLVKETEKERRDRMREKWKESKKRQRRREKLMSPASQKKYKLRRIVSEINKLKSDEISHVIKQVTPGKRTRLKLDFTSTPERTDAQFAQEIKDKIAFLKGKKDPESIAQLRILTAGTTKNVANLHHQTFRKYSALTMEDSYFRKDRCDKISETEKERIIDFFFDNATPLPTSRQGGKLVLNDAQRKIYQKYKEMDDVIPAVSFSFFAKLKPETVLNVDRNKFIVCLCEYCINATFLVSDIFFAIC